MRDTARRISCLSVVLRISETIPAASAESRIENAGLSPAWTASSRSILRPIEWKVVTIRPLVFWPCSSFDARSCISRAALLVKVMAAIEPGL
jgi:hypothetical protein